MKLRSLKLLNYRSLPDTEFQVRGNLVLVGPNDVGKSAILRALDILLGNTGGQLVGAFSESDFRDQHGPLVFECVLGEFSDSERAAFSDEIDLTGGEEVLRIRLQAELSPEDPLEVVVSRFCPDSGFERPLRREQLEAIGWEYIPASRSLYNELGGSRSGIVRSLLGQVDLGESRAAIETALGGVAEALDSSDELANLRRDLAQALSTAFPGVVSGDQLKVLLSSDLANETLSDARIGLGDKDSGYRSINEQSDGLRALAVIAAYSLAHLGANIVAVDEPEMHLHPTAQRLVGALLANSAAQTVVATHSSSVASRAAPSDIVSVRKDLPPGQLPGGVGEEIFFAARWWSDAFIQPLTARHIIVVEGPSERILAEKVAEVLELGLDRSGVHILDLDGADNFIHAYRTFGDPGFGVPMTGICDEDHRESWAKVIGVEPDGLEGRGYAVCNRDLEAETASALGGPRVAELLIRSGLFSERRILTGTGSDDLHVVDVESIASFMRDPSRNKTRAAAALAHTMELSDAERLGFLIAPLREALA